MALRIVTTITGTDYAGGTVSRELVAEAPISTHEVLTSAFTKAVGLLEAWRAIVAGPAPERQEPERQEPLRTPPTEGEPGRDVVD